MAKYSRRDSRSITLNSTTIGWGVAIALSVLTATFFLGMYYGYSRGYQSAKEDIGNDTQKVASAGNTSTERASSESVESSKESESNQTESSTDRKSEITESDLNFSSSDDQNSSNDQERSDASQSSSMDNTERSSSSTSSQTSTTSSSNAQPESGEAVEPPYYTIQISSSQKKENSKRVRDELRDQNHNAIITEATVNGELYYRVRVGKFKTRSKASRYAKNMKEKGHISDFWISKVTP